MADIDIGQSYNPYIGSSSVCGDVGTVIEFNKKCLLALIDGLGHGPKANEAATAAKIFIEKNYDLDPVETMKGLHEDLKSTIGAVAAICVLDIETGKMDCVGIGNITVRILGSASKVIVPKDGVVGYMMRSPEKKSWIMNDGDVLLLYSDGIKTHISREDRKTFLNLPAQAIADSILRKYGKNDDDNSCVVLKYYK